MRGAVPIAGARDHEVGDQHQFDARDEEDRAGTAEQGARMPLCHAVRQAGSGVGRGGPEHEPAVQEA